jgi:glycosyltransferase involved in cell wall biosynthesis
MIFFGMQDITEPRILPNGILQVGVRYDPFGADICEDYARVYKADAFLSMLDLWIPQTSYMPEMCQRLKIPYVAHTTINSEPLSPFLAGRLAGADFIVAPSKYNLRVLQQGNMGYKSFYIPHGVDLNVFKPTSEFKDDMRKRLHVENKEFIGLVVNRNKGMQKRLQDIMKTWAFLCNQDPVFKQKSILLMLHDPLEPDGFRTDMYRDRIKMQENIMFIWQKPTPDYNDMVATYEGDPEGMRHNANISLPPSEVAKLYNIADIHMVSSQSESFSLPTIEALACGVPCVMGNHSTAPELIGESGGGLMVNIAYNETTPLLSEVMNMDLTDLANKLRLLYSDEKLRRECGQKGIAHAQKYGWDDILSQWKMLFEQVEQFRMTPNYQFGRMGL